MVRAVEVLGGQHGLAAVVVAVAADDPDEGDQPEDEGASGGLGNRCGIDHQAGTQIGGGMFAGVKKYTVIGSD